jgi:hypothetical protein
VFAVATTDTDAIVFGSAKVVTNLFQGDSIEELDLELILAG